ncbi:hypothetical protein [Streptomyces sp. NPDC008121]|uniref:hypothetical protein n=1 Tax=Streptomyces sp. NPDC008121 TaxID=3364809 RepID=UPI0036ED267A
MGWKRDGFPAHEGTVGVLLADGSEPGPACFGAGSGGHVHESTDWWVYDGTLGAPRAERIRARCACGWRGAAAYPIDWESVVRRDPYAYDTSEAERDWESHLEDVEGRSVPLPAEVSDLLHELRRRLEQLVDDAPLAAVKAAGRLEAMAGAVGSPAAYLAVRGAEVSWHQVAEALGTTVEEARSRLLRYEYRR